MCARADPRTPPAPAPTTAAPTAVPPAATKAPVAIAPTTVPTAIPPTATKGPTQGGVLKISTVPDADILGYPPTMTKLNDFYFAATSLETLITFD